MTDDSFNPGSDHPRWSQGSIQAGLSWPDSYRRLERHIMTDEDRINDGIKAAQREGRPIDDLTARIIASRWHGGQFTALCALASTGALDLYSDGRDDNCSAEDELQDELVYWREHPSGSYEDVRELVALYAYCVVGRSHDRAPVAGWSNLHW